MKIIFLVDNNALFVKVKTKITINLRSLFDIAESVGNGVSRLSDLKIFWVGDGRGGACPKTP